MVLYALVEPHKLIGLVERQRPQQHGFNHGIHRRHAANANCQRQYRGQSESRRLAQLPQCIVDIAQQRFDERQPALRPISLFCLRHAAEFAQSRGPRMLRESCPLDIFIKGEIDVTPQFFVEIVVELLLAEQRRASS
jgi:hypothetical protein